MTDDPEYLPADKHYARLPKTILSSSLLITNEDDEVLLVRPNYKATAGTQWEIVGGGVDEGEYPLDAAIREGKEELGGGLTVTPTRLLVVDFTPPSGPQPMLMTSVFDCGILTNQEAKKISLPEKELAEWGFFPVDQIADLVVDRLARRIATAARARTLHKTWILHDGYRQDL